MNVNHKNWLKLKCQNYVSNLTCQLCFHSLNFRFQAWNFKRGCSYPNSLPVWRLARIITPITGRLLPPPARYRLEPMLKFQCWDPGKRKSNPTDYPPWNWQQVCPCKVNGWKMNFLLEYLLWRGRASFRSVHFNHLSVQSTNHQDIAHLLVIVTGKLVYPGCHLSSSTTRTSHLWIYNSNRMLHHGLDLLTRFGEMISETSRHWRSQNCPRSCWRSPWTAPNFQSFEFLISTRCRPDHLQSS